MSVSICDSHSFRILDVIASPNLLSAVWVEIMFSPYRSLTVFSANNPEFMPRLGDHAARFATNTS